MRSTILIVVSVLSGCAGPPDVPQTHVGTCTHFNSNEHAFDNVPNCLLRGRDTLINGLAPMDTGQQS